MMQFIRHASASMQRGAAGKLTFLYFDIENFKSFNQRYGFRQGNVFLRYMADLLREIFNGDLIARFNDDHFAVATERENIADGIQFIHERIRSYEVGLAMEVKTGVYHPDADVTDIVLIMDRARWRRPSISAAISSARSTRRCSRALSRYSISRRFA